ncbi:hypothetical protein [Verrucosispora sp. NA02020]|uniref:hypothetical protein n=1 Tax=Verrucosispora sp. NA02020 TaxID=2742132 RepID=UPI0015926447|nr:hypothetical protein [Verrucosispora sp. NA02020]QKW15362.1 hypothetical protein HUT12_23090 [Verrucosispora sp. NA02020]
MSYIAFHTREQTGYISGSERAHVDILVRKTAAQHRRSVFGHDSPDRPSLLRKAVNWPGDTTRSNRFDQWSDTHIAVSHDKGLHAILPDGPTAETLLNIDLNTVIAHGTPAVQLVARISGQCEVHAFVEGTDRAWFADHIDAATNAGVLRRDMSCYPLRADNPNGWTEVAQLVRSTDSGPIVMSYSVCDGFPNRETAAWPDSLPDQDENPDDFDAAEQVWMALSPAERWDQAMAGLRRKAETAWLLRISPDNLGTAAFGTETPLTWHDIAAAWQGETVGAR